MTTPRPLPPIEMLRSLFDYNPETGNIVWKVNRGNKKVGDRAGVVNNRGYRQIVCCKVAYLAHRMAWALHYGEDPGPHEMDHIDRDRLNNRVTNLRKVTRGENSNNRAPYGLVAEKYIHPSKGSFRVIIRNTHIGCCKTLEEAVRLRDEYIRTTSGVL